jgi:hypothetical protein
MQRQDEQGIEQRLEAAHDMTAVELANYFAELEEANQVAEARAGQIGFCFMEVDF